MEFEIGSEIRYAGQVERGKPYFKRTGEPIIDGIRIFCQMGADTQRGLDPDVMRAYRDDLRFWDERFKEETGIDPFEEEE